MAQTTEKSTYGTIVSQSDFGVNFSHADGLYQAHDRMQGWLSRTINDLNALINEFGDKTQTVNNAYKGLEMEGVATMNKYQQELD
ncbi:hypothetical protein ACGFX4_29660 [Kitasatospora sp. NPDC048365]|uniref:hypothetical protein n=1 Tax=Kitasatospora sp. NPDC048365 TaxID=3364050 RepID=UPI00371A1916